MATIVHFDIGAEKPERAKTFYENLFGWKIELLSGPSPYLIIETFDLKGQRGIGGGIAKRETNQPEGIVNYIGVSSIDESLETAKRLGGKIIQSKQAIPGWGYLAVCHDTENNKFGIFQDDSKAI